MKFEWKGKQRTYEVHAPPGYDPGKQYPLVVAMHPYPGTAQDTQQLSGLNDKADTEDFLVAYPEGLDGGYNALICCGEEDDVGYIGEVVKRLKEKWNADPKRVYATGISNGGDMTFKLAVEIPETFAAIAPVSGGYSGEATEKATYIPKSPVSVITFIGELDKYEDTFKTGMATWKKRLQCKDAADGKRTKSYRWTRAGCGDGSEVEVYVLHEMGHSWPGATEGALADEEAGAQATDLMWTFFKAHTLK